MTSFRFLANISLQISTHDDAIKWKRYWPCVWGIHRSPVNSPHKDQWRGTLMFSLICAWMNGWVNNREVGDLKRQHAHYDVTVMNRAFVSCVKICRGHFLTKLWEGNEVPNWITIESLFVEWRPWLVCSLYNVLNKWLHLLWSVRSMSYPFLNANGTGVEVWEWMANFLPHFFGRVITYTCD